MEANSSSLAPALIAVFTISPIWRLSKTLQRVKVANNDGLYKDEDGKATQESMSKYSTRPQFGLIFVAVVIGLAASFVLGVVATLWVLPFALLSRIWFLFFSWILASLQVLDTFQEPRPVSRYRRGLVGTVSFILIGFQAGLVILGEVPDSSSNIVVHLTAGLQTLSAVAVILAFSTVERRPDVFNPDGKLVERQYQTSLWTSFSFSWSSDILDLAAAKLIQISDLPAMNAHVRAKEAKETFKSIALKSTTSLWIRIIWAFRFQLIRQWLLVILQAIFGAAPQFAMLKLLQYLEMRQDSFAIDPYAWLWVGSLFLATASETVVDTRVSWLMWSELGLPIRSTLTSLIFEKLMHLKDCKEPPKSETNQDDIAAQSINSQQTSGNSPVEKREAPKKKDKGQQDIINMFAVDTNQVGQFGGVSQFYVMFASKFVVSIVFLLTLVGWESLLAGMVAVVVVFPFNRYLAKRYKSVQKELMKSRDKKTAVISEALQGIRQIKFSALEPEWTKKIMDVREEELIKLWQNKLINLYMMLGGEIAPAFLTVFALATYSFIHGELLPSVAFTALGVFIQLESVLHMVPMLFVMGINAKVSCDRIDNFLRSPEKPENTYPGDSIRFDNVSISFPSNPMDSTDATEEDIEREANKFILRDLTLHFPKDALSVISGPTGSGKSLLLAAILGEVEVLAGSITVPRGPMADQRFDAKANAADWVIPSAIAFVSQNPWIENATIKDNILFGLPDDPIRYEEVIRACSFVKDLAMFEDGDLSEVGAQGISLSGGQKWRLTLARAFYSRAGILILDDVFSALDTHVGKEIYDNLLTGDLARGRTRILVTHHVELCLPRAEYAVRLSAKGILEYAGPTEALQPKRNLDQLLRAEQDVETTSVEEEEASDSSLSGQVSVFAVKDQVAKTTPKKLIEDEKRETGAVKRRVYTTYLKATGGAPFWSFVLMFFLLAQALYLSRSWWIKIWTSSYEHSRSDMEYPTNVYAMQTQLGNPTTGSIITGSFLVNQTRVTLSDFFSAFAASKVVSTIRLDEAATVLSANPPVTDSFFVIPTGHQGQKLPGKGLPIDTNNRSLGFYLAGYVIISVISVFIDVWRYYIVFRSSLKASRDVLERMTFRVLRTPLRWLDTVPMGRILNRFTTDFQLLDSQLASYFADTGASFISVIGIMVAASIVSPYIIILALALLGICGGIGLRYIKGARSIKRLVAIQKSPMISLFAASLEGLSTIRAYAKSQIFESRMHDLIDSYTTSIWHNWLFNNWVGFRLGMIGSIFSTFVAIFVIATRGIDASLGGFALAYALSYRTTVNSTIRLLAMTELGMNAAERIFEYSDVEIEDQGGSNIRASWPEKGHLEVNNLEVAYAKGLPLILKGLTFHAEMNQRVGIVGRTGAGKSTLSLALFRFLEPRNGSIVIDGVDISTIKLHDLRTRLAIIPQDPVLFSGTIRSNLDPFDQYSDFQLKEALQRVHLTPSASNSPVAELETVTQLAPSREESSATSVTATEAVAKENTNVFLSLRSPISSSGANISQGQKQLLCLARAILSRPKLIILDEATSAVDMKTDELIQRSIREEFSNTTLLVVAHRLSTVADFDRILVMKDGVAAEFGTPKELLALEDGVFRDMVEHSGEKRTLEETILGN